MGLKHSHLPANIGMLNYFILSFQALEMNPELAEHGHRTHELEVDKWQLIIRNSIDSGEVKQDTDVEKAARLFINVRHGIGVMSTYTTSMEESIDAIDEMYQYIFSLIKA